MIFVRKSCKLQGFCECEGAFTIQCRLCVVKTNFSWRCSKLLECCSIVLKCGASCLKLGGERVRANVLVALS